MKIRLGTRGSQLARAQSGWVADLLRQRGHEVEMVVVKTKGDLQLDRAFAQIGQPGVFVREIEIALEEQRIDLAVHSYKDLPSIGPEGLSIVAVPERLGAADRLLFRPEARAGSPGPIPLKQGARVGTAAARRQALLHDMRPDLQVEMLRGNLPRRVQRLLDGDFDAILLAAAGLDRLDRLGALPRDGVEEIDLDPSVFVPAPSQGALALQVRSDDAETGAAVAALDDVAAHRAVRAERRLLELVEGGCHAAVGAWCRDLSHDAEAATDVGSLQMIAMAGIEGDANAGSSRSVRYARDRGDDPIELAERIARVLKGEA